MPFSKVVLYIYIYIYIYITVKVLHTNTTGYPHKIPNLSQL